MISLRRMEVSGNVPRLREVGSGDLSPYSPGTTLAQSFGDSIFVYMVRRWCIGSLVVIRIRVDEHEADL